MDRYQDLVTHGITGRVARRIGFPRPPTLRRYSPGDPLLPGAALVIGPDEDADALTKILLGWGLTAHRQQRSGQYAAIIVVLTEANEPADLTAVIAPLQDGLRRLAANGRVITISRPAIPGDPTHAATREAVQGLLRSLAKELRQGATGNGLLLADGLPISAPSVGTALRFLLSRRSAFVDGQLLQIDSPGRLPSDWERPLDGQVAVVTGAARGIGAAIAHALHRDGAHVILVDVPSAGDRLAETANLVRGTALHLDVTASDAGQRICDLASARYGRLDIVVHNAGITRDKLLVNMRPDQWEQVLAVNLQSHLRINQTLLDVAANGLFADTPRIVALASTSGIAGNRGQTNYATAKAGVLGWVQATAPLLAAYGGTANGVAPGFIETEMTARIPTTTREFARRLNTLLQGGQPSDVAEAVAFLASPGATGIIGQTLRVCGQNLVGR